jgi:hypothetical protein
MKLTPKELFQIAHPMSLRQRSLRRRTTTSNCTRGTRSSRV